MNSDNCDLWVEVQGTSLCMRTVSTSAQPSEVGRTTVVITWPKCHCERTGESKGEWQGHQNSQGHQRQRNSR